MIRSFRRFLLISLFSHYLLHFLKTNQSSMNCFSGHNFGQPQDHLFSPADLTTDNRLRTGNLLPHSIYRFRLAVVTRNGGRGQWSESLILYTDHHNDHLLHSKRQMMRQSSNDSPLEIKNNPKMTVSSRGEVHHFDTSSANQDSPHQHNKLRARIHGGHVAHHHTGPQHLHSSEGILHRQLPCIGPLAVLCPHSQTVTVEHIGEHRHHLRKEHHSLLVSNKAHRYQTAGATSKLPAWLLHWSPRSYDVRAELVLAHPIRACQTLHARDHPDSPQREIIGRIAVVARGSCSLYKKVRRTWYRKNASEID